MDMNDAANKPVVQSFGVLAGAYLPRHFEGENPALLTHGCEVDGAGYPVRVLCKGVKIEHICPDGWTDAELSELPTCPVCRKRDPRAPKTFGGLKVGTPFRMPNDPGNALLKKISKTHYVVAEGDEFNRGLKCEARADQVVLP